MSQIKYKLSILSIFILVTACNFGPKTAEPYTITRVIDKNAKSSEVDYEMHEIVIEELLPTPKYIYARVKEGEEFYWIATQKQDLEIGKPYLYNESLLKTQFESKEYGRIFDTLFLVTTLVPKDHGVQADVFHSKPLGEQQLKNIKKSLLEQDDSTAPFVGYVKISDLVNNPEKYKDKKVELSGTCVKVNLGVMNRNWIHLQDGSNDEYDLVITSNETIEKDAQITIQGIVRLQVDFGSNYSYPILVENGKLVQ